MMFKAVIFDMDGVLIDSELYIARAELGFLKKYGVEITPELIGEIQGRSIQEEMEIIKAKFKLEISVDELIRHSKKDSEFVWDYQAEELPGAKELFEILKKEKFVLAIASGSSLDRIIKIVSRFGWEKYFNAIVSTDEVLKGKPDPAIYNYTSKVLEIPVKNCVVIEDSVNGVLSAKNAGMRCIAVPDFRWNYGDYSAADLVAHSLSDPKVLEFIRNVSTSTN